MAFLSQKAQFQHYSEGTIYFAANDETASTLVGRIPSKSAMAIMPVLKIEFVYFVQHVYAMVYHFSPVTQIFLQGS